jgi:hypothetical protein
MKAIRLAAHRLGIGVLVSFSSLAGSGFVVSSAGEGTVSVAVLFLLIFYLLFFLVAHDSPTV